MRVKQEPRNEVYRQTDADATPQEKVEKNKRATALAAVVPSLFLRFAFDDRSLAGMVVAVAVWCGSDFALLSSGLLHSQG